MFNDIPQVGMVAPWSAVRNFACPAGGFTDNAEHVIFSSQVGKRQALSFLYIKNTNATATEFTILDKTSGTVIFRAYLGASMSSAEYFNFDNPLISQIGADLICKNGTTGAAVYVSAEGFSYYDPSVNGMTFDKPI
jgi:hypothetical protein